MIGPFKPAPGNFAYIYVAIDKFSKWIECKPLVKATAQKAADFIDEIIHRFGLPNTIITDLGSTFTGEDFFDICDESLISVKYVSVAHPRANGQAERANSIVIEALHKRVYERDGRYPGKWLRELLLVVINSYIYHQLNNKIWL